MTDRGMVRAPYGGPARTRYTGDGNRVVAAANQQISEGFRTYLESRGRIDSDRRITDLTRVQRKLALVEKTVEEYDHDLSRPEKDALARENLNLLAITDAHTETARRIRGGESTHDVVRVYLGHVPLADFVNLYAGDRRKFGGAILEELCGGQKPDLQELLVEGPSMSGRHEMVIPAKDIPEFQRRFERYFIPEIGLSIMQSQGPDGGNGRSRREIGPEEARRLIAIGEWPTHC